MKKYPSTPVVLPPVKVSSLRHHFRTTYQLKDDQVELMILSSQKSLEATFIAAREALLAADVASQLVKVVHNLKGVLLNMGEPRWAELARDIEVAATNNDDKDYAAAIKVLVDGVVDITTYKPGVK